MAGAGVGMFLHTKRFQQYIDKIDYVEKNYEQNQKLTINTLLAFMLQT